MVEVTLITFGVEKKNANRVNERVPAVSVDRELHETWPF
jgi:hypothetical protein